MHFGLAILAAAVLTVSAHAQEPFRAAPPVVPAKLKIDKKLYTPADVSRAMAIDALALSKTLVSEEMYNIRYIAIANCPSEQRADRAAQVSLGINRLSRRRNIVIPAPVGPDSIVLRVNLADYGISPAAWDRLADIEVYFHEKFTETDLHVTEVETSRKTPYEVEVPWLNEKGEKLYWPDGKQAMKKVTKYKEDINKQTTTREGAPVAKVGIASWLDPEAMAHVVRLTQSKNPALRGDWFLANAFLPPIYYDFLELKTLDDVKELALYDKRAERFSEVRATVTRSGELATRVARNNRILKRVKTAHGAWWETFDFKSSVGDQNLIYNFLTGKRDGSEIIFSLPNGLHGYFLVDDKDARVDEVPIAIAVDSLAQDARVRCGRSCIWCHSRGIQPFKSSFKTVVNVDNLVDLGIADKGDPKKTATLIRSIKEMFEFVDFDALVAIDNVHYENAVKAATGGRTAPAMAAGFLRLYDDYAEVDLDGDQLVYEAGAPDLDVQAAVKISINGRDNGVILQRVLKPPVNIRRDQWEEHYGEFMRRVIAWQAAKVQIGPPPPPALLPAKEGGNP